MEELISKLGIDWKLFIAQIINFLVLLAILYRFLYKPLLLMMEKRRQGIEDSLIKAKKIEENVKKSDAERQEILTQARQESQELLQKAKEQAKDAAREIAEAAKKEVVQMSVKAREEIDRQKETALSEVKSEVGGLIAAAVRQIMDDNMSAKVDEKYINQTLKEIK